MRSVTCVKARARCLLHCKYSICVHFSSFLQLGVLGTWGTTLSTSSCNQFSPLFSTPLIHPLKILPSRTTGEPRAHSQCPVLALVSPYLSPCSMMLFPISVPWPKILAALSPAFLIGWAAAKGSAESQTGVDQRTQVPQSQVGVCFREKLLIVNNKT